MRLQSLPKVLCPVALACAWAVAQEPPAAPAEPSENTVQLEPAKPIQEIPADQSQPPPAPAPAEQAPPVETPIVPIEGENPAVIEDPNLPPVQPVPLEGSAVTDGTVGPPPELSG
ncbi:MAG: hypothetical protein JWO82_482, partial [Akkermansiaceae bacterium]|nr:hypothetical protein [Akkermansiaceae bacterium]